MLYGVLVAFHGVIGDSSGMIAEIIGIEVRKIPFIVVLCGLTWEGSQNCFDLRHHEYQNLRNSCIRVLLHVDDNRIEI